MSKLNWVGVLKSKSAETLTPFSASNEIRVAPNLQCASVNCSELDQGLQFCQHCSEKIEHFGGLRSEVKCAHCASMLVPNMGGSVEERWCTFEL